MEAILEKYNEAVSRAQKLRYLASIADETDLSTLSPKTADEQIIFAHLACIKRDNAAIMALITSDSVAVFRELKMMLARTAIRTSFIAYANQHDSAFLAALAAASKSMADMITSRVIHSKCPEARVLVQKLFATATKEGRRKLRGALPAEALEAEIERKFARKEAVEEVVMKLDRCHRTPELATVAVHLIPKWYESHVAPKLPGASSKRDVLREFVDPWVKVLFRSGLLSHPADDRRTMADFLWDFCTEHMKPWYIAKTLHARRSRDDAFHAFVQWYVNRHIREALDFICFQADRTKLAKYAIDIMHLVLPYTRAMGLSQERADFLAVLADSMLTTRNHNGVAAVLEHTNIMTREEATTALVRTVTHYAAEYDNLTVKHHKRVWSVNAHRIRHDLIPAATRVLFAETMWRHRVDLELDRDNTELIRLAGLLSAEETANHTSAVETELYSGFGTRSRVIDERQAAFQALFTAGHRDNICVSIRAVRGVMRRQNDEWFVPQFRSMLTALVAIPSIRTMDAYARTQLAALYGDVLTTFGAATFEGQTLANTMLAVARLALVHPACPETRKCLADIALAIVRYFVPKDSVNRTFPRDSVGIDTFDFEKEWAILYTRPGDYSRRLIHPRPRPMKVAQKERNAIIRRRKRLSRACAIDLALVQPILDYCLPHVLTPAQERLGDSLLTVVRNNQPVSSNDYLARRCPVAVVYGILGNLSAWRRSLKKYLASIDKNDALIRSNVLNVFGVKHVGPNTPYSQPMWCPARYVEVLRSALTTAIDETKAAMTHKHVPSSEPTMTATLRRLVQTLAALPIDTQPAVKSALTEEAAIAAEMHSHALAGLSESLSADVDLMVCILRNANVANVANAMMTKALDLAPAARLLAALQTIVGAATTLSPMGVRVVCAFLLRYYAARKLAVADIVPLLASLWTACKPARGAVLFVTVETLYQQHKAGESFDPVLLGIIAQAAEQPDDQQLHKMLICAVSDAFTDLIDFDNDRFDSTGNMSCCGPKQRELAEEIATRMLPIMQHGDETIATSMLEALATADLPETTRVPSLVCLEARKFVQSAGERNITKRLFKATLRLAYDPAEGPAGLCNALEALKKSVDDRITHLAAETLEDTMPPRFIGPMVRNVIIDISRTTIPDDALAALCTSVADIVEDSAMVAEGIADVIRAVAVTRTDLQPAEEKGEWLAPHAHWFRKLADYLTTLDRASWTNVVGALKHFLPMDDLVATPLMECIDIAKTYNSDAVWTAVLHIADTQTAVRFTSVSGKELISALMQKDMPVIARKWAFGKLLRRGQ
ncbi:hypothetical protein J8273_7547 [Carpediemonas membranifera]|uniref:Uncharacterized protein n=1 Tax=Carpediemonas membranifera TaxID=201153 RepID=A0A8J6AQN1_9EUKA|nr:hypothetical protein J8273_7547 [Carpediemonas membranifera]|eukprot:KAG9391273.1 hypothetical protein J8273_7547 [Carpediemonas membranifera]